MLFFALSTSVLLYASTMLYKTLFSPFGISGLPDFAVKANPDLNLNALILCKHEIDFPLFLKDFCNFLCHRYNTNTRLNHYSRSDMYSQPTFACISLKISFMQSLQSEILIRKKAVNPKTNCFLYFSLSV